MEDYRYRYCEECENYTHCYGNIEKEEFDNLYIMPSNCEQYYPGRKQ